MFANWGKYERIDLTPIFNQYSQSRECGFMLNFDVKQRIFTNGEYVEQPSLPIEVLYSSIPQTVNLEKCMNG